MKRRDIKGLPDRNYEKQEYSMKSIHNCVLAVATVAIMPFVQRQLQLPVPGRRTKAER